MVDRLPVFKTIGGTFDIELPENIVIIGGNSSTGKSYLYQNLIERADLARDMREDSVFAKVYGVNYASLPMLTVDWLKSKSDIILLIDNASLLLDERELWKYIDKDYSNQYIVFGRGDFGLHTSFFGRGELKQDDDGVFRVHYHVVRK